MGKVPGRQGIHYSVDGGVAVITVDRPPANALNLAVRAGLMAAIERAGADAKVRAVVLMGAGATFPAGADLTELNSAPKSPTLRDVTRRIEGLAKPVVAALHGTVYGAGLELALAAHYRIAAPGTRASHPEVRIGLVPSAGGTQRLPRLLGAGPALDMLLNGGPVALDKADQESDQGQNQGAGQETFHALVDALARTELRAEAVAFAQICDGPRPTQARTDGFADPAAYRSALQQQRTTLQPAMDSAQDALLRLVEAAPLLPFEAGLAMEEDAFDTCLASEAAQGLRHALVAERRARDFALPKDTPRPEIRRIAVLGPGPLALQIVVSALNAGIEVNWGAKKPERLAEDLAQVRDIFEASVAKGGLSAAQVQARLQHLRSGHSAEMLQDVDIALHAAKGQGDVPAPRSLVRVVTMASRVDAVGLRFAPPVFSTRLAEVIEGPQATAHQMAHALALAERLNKVPVRVRSQGGSVAGALTTALHRAADSLLDLGADPYAVDAAVESWGWSRPPFRLRDVQGLEDLAQAERGAGAHNWSQMLVLEGRTGWIAGQGFYDWPDVGAPEDGSRQVSGAGQAGRASEASEDSSGPRKASAVRRLLRGVRPDSPWEAEEILFLLIGALANAGARMVAQGMVQRASDIDAVAVLALDFPRAHGGPMCAVAHWGMLKVMKRLERLDHPDRAFWQPVPEWGEHVKYGRAFV